MVAVLQGGFVLLPGLLNNSTVRGVQATKDATPILLAEVKSSHGCQNLSCDMGAEAHLLQQIGTLHKVILLLLFQQARIEG